MDLSSKRLGFGVVLSSFVFVTVACAAPTIPNDGLSNDGSDPSQPVTSSKTPAKTTPKPTPTTTGTSTTPPPADTTTPPTTTPPTTGTDCTAQTTNQACFDCCNTASGGALKVADDAFGQCACGGGACTSVCSANFCAGGVASAACNSCLTQCDQAASAACTSAACQSGEQCLQTSGCDAKP